MLYVFIPGDLKLAADQEIVTVLETVFCVTAPKDCSAEINKVGGVFGNVRLTDPLAE